MNQRRTFNWLKAGSWTAAKREIEPKKKEKVSESLIIFLLLLLLLLNNGGGKSPSHPPEQICHCPAIVRVFRPLPENSVGHRWVSRCLGKSC